VPGAALEGSGDPVTVVDFGTKTLPYGVFRPPGLAPRVGVAVGELVLDLSHLIDSPKEFAQPSLNTFLAAGHDRWREVRSFVTARVASGVTAGEDGVYAQGDVEVLRPVEVADFVDFFSGIEHAVNMGRILRPDDANPLKPNYRHLPVGYHGRAGTVIPSGVGIVRPCGQVRTADGATRHRDGTGIRGRCPLAPGPAGARERVPPPRLRRRHPDRLECP
jgi:fumarylacetoacetase